MIAPLPDSEWGRLAVDVYLKSRRGARLSSGEKKIVTEVKERALLYITYATLGMGLFGVEALMSRGVGPQRAKRGIEKLIRKGEEGFYEEILRAEEEYIANRKYWDKS